MHSQTHKYTNTHINNSNTRKHTNTNIYTQTPTHTTYTEIHKHTSPLTVKIQTSLFKISTNRYIIHVSNTLDAVLPSKETYYSCFSERKSSGVDVKKNY